MSAALTFDEAVAAVQRATGCDYARAVELVRQDGSYAASEPKPVVRDERVLEKAEQVEVRKLAIAYGFRIYNLSQARASKQTPGLPDLYLVHEREPFAAWWETKRSVGGQLSSAQKDFQEVCRRACVIHGVGDRWAFAEFLLQYEFATRGAGPCGIEPIGVMR